MRSNSRKADLELETHHTRISTLRRGRRTPLVSPRRRMGIDLNDGVLQQGLRSDQLVAGGVIDHLGRLVEAVR